MFGFKKEDSAWFIFAAIFAVWIYLLNALSVGDIVPMTQVFGAIISGMVLALTPWSIVKLFVRSRRETTPPASDSA